MQKAVKSGIMSPKSAVAACEAISNILAIDSDRNGRFYVGAIQHFHPFFPIIRNANDFMHVSHIVFSCTLLSAASPQIKMTNVQTQKYIEIEPININDDNGNGFFFPPKGMPSIAFFSTHFFCTV